MKNALQKSTARIDREADRAMHLLFSSMLIFLHRKYGMGKVRLGRFIDEMLVAFNECGGTNERSMIQILDEETGLEIRCDDGSQWRDYPYLNAALWDRKQPSYAQAIYIRQRMLKWVYPSLLATMLLAVSRRFGWKSDKLVTVYNGITETRNEFHSNPKELKMAAEQITGISYDLRNGTIWVHPYREICKGCEYTEEKCLNCEKRKEFDKNLFKERGATDDN